MKSEKSTEPEAVQFIQEVHMRSIEQLAARMGRDPASLTQSSRMAFSAGVQAGFNNTIRILLENGILVPEVVPQDQNSLTHSI